MSRKTRGLMRSLGPATTLNARPKNQPPLRFFGWTGTGTRFCGLFLGSGLRTDVEETSISGRVVSTDSRSSTTLGGGPWDA